MKRKLKTFFTMLIFWIGMCPSVCFADVISPPDPSEYIGPLVWWGIIAIGIVVIIVSLLSIFFLKFVVTQEEIDDYNRGEYKEDTEKNKKVKKHEKIIYILTIIIVSMIVIYELGMSDAWIQLLISAVLIIISIIFRKIGKKKTSYIVAILIVIVSTLECLNIGNYNEQFSKDIRQYTKTENRIHSTTKYISNIEGMIETVIQHNEAKHRKIIIKYREESENSYNEYSSTDELNQLLSQIKPYKGYILYLKEDNMGYTKYIELSGDLMIQPRSLEDILIYSGNYKRGSEVNRLIKTVLNVITDEETYVEFNIIYKSNTEQSITINNVDGKKFEQLENFRKDNISTSKLYNVKIESNRNKCNILITPNE